MPTPTRTRPRSSVGLALLHLSGNGDLSRLMIFIRANARRNISASVSGRGIRRRAPAFQLLVKCRRSRRSLLLHQLAHDGLHGLGRLYKVVMIIFSLFRSAKCWLVTYGNLQFVVEIRFFFAENCKKREKMREKRFLRHRRSNYTMFFAPPLMEPFFHL